MKKLALLILSFCVLTLNSYSQTLTTNKKYYKPGEQITVSFTAPSGYSKNAWIGLIPSEVPHGKESVNDHNDRAYKYLEGKTSGTFVFEQKNLGKFDLRMNDTDDNGREVASVSFVITNNIPPTDTTTNATTLDQAAFIGLSKKHFQPNENIVVTFKAPAGLKSNAWIGIIPSSIKHGDENVNDQHDVSYQYLSNKTSGTLNFKAPSKIGNWDLRMNSADGGGKELTSISFTVSGEQASNNSGIINQPTTNTPITSIPKIGNIIFQNGNKSSVFNGTKNNTYFYVWETTIISSILNYHWNNGKGSEPGQIGLRNASGLELGNWQAVGSEGMRGVKNANWTVYPNITLQPGIYQITDSEIATWSQNSGSYGAGFSVVKAK